MCGCGVSGSCGGGGGGVSGSGSYSGSYSGSGSGGGGSGSGITMFESSRFLIIIFKYNIIFLLIFVVIFLKFNRLVVKQFASVFENIVFLLPPVPLYNEISA